MELTDVLSAGRLGLDTCLFIYLIEEHETFLPIVEPIFAAIDGGRITAVTSAITLLETLVVPYRAKDELLAARYEAVLARSRGLEMVDVDRRCLREAAQLRARHRIAAPDAIQLAAAIGRRCPVFVTNDRALPVLENITVVQLRDLVPRRPSRRQPR